MMNEKRTWIVLFTALTLIVILAGCSGLPKIAEISMVADPNPVPYDSETEKWLFNVIFAESNGVGVTLTSVRFDAYDQADQLYHTQFLYEEDIIDWFESNYIPAFSSLSSWVSNKSAETVYDIFTIEGVDDNENPVEATGRVDYLPK